MNYRPIPPPRLSKKSISRPTTKKAPVAPGARTETNHTKRPYSYIVARRAEKGKVSK